MFRLAKEPSPGQSQSLNHVHNGVCVLYGITYYLQNISGHSPNILTVFKYFVSNMVSRKVHIRHYVRD
jgi:hypothetical protein